MPSIAVIGTKNGHIQAHAITRNLKYFKIVNHVNKYRNRKTEYEGILFDSAREALRYSELIMLQRTGIISQLELQPRFPLVVNGMKVCEYRADFRYQSKDGKTVIEDAKGVRTRDYVLKRKLLEALTGFRVIEV